MSAYVISEVRPLDADLFAQYRQLAAKSITDHGGRFIVRGGATRAAEGTFPQGFVLTIIEFPSMEALQRWYESDEYAEALVYRNRGALERRMLFADGAG